MLFIYNIFENILCSSQLQWQVTNYGIINDLFEKIQQKNKKINHWKKLIIN